MAIDCLSWKSPWAILLYLCFGFILLTKFFPSIFQSDLDKRTEKCVPFLENAMRSIWSDYGWENGTKRFLKSPEHYNHIAVLCQNAIDCTQESTQHAISDPILSGFMNKYQACEFFSFYNGAFKNCANKLISLRGNNISCIETIFDEKFEVEQPMCKMWDEAQECLRGQIDKSCEVDPSVGQKQLRLKLDYEMAQFEKFRTVLFYCD